MTIQYKLELYDEYDYVPDSLNKFSGAWFEAKRLGEYDLKGKNYVTGPLQIRYDDTSIDVPEGCYDLLDLFESYTISGVTFDASKSYRHASAVITAAGRNLNLSHCTILNAPYSSSSALLYAYPTTATHLTHNGERIGTYTDRLRNWAIDGLFLPTPAPAEYSIPVETVPGRRAIPGLPRLDNSTNQLRRSVFRNNFWDARSHGTRSRSRGR